MAGSFSDYTENKVLDHILKTSAFTVPTNIYVALYIVAPTDAGGGTEVTGGSYERKLYETWDVASGGVTANTNPITFIQATASWGTIVAVGLFDASTGGNFLMWADLDSSQTVDSGEIFEFIAGALDITLT